MENRDRTIEELNDILAKNYDGLAGYRKAAEKSKNTFLMGYFNRRVNERKIFIDELTSEVRALGGEPTDDGTIQGTAHRMWLNLKAGFSDDNSEELLEECITGEKNALEEYDDLLEENYVPASTRTLLNKQKRMIQKALMELERQEEIVD